MWTKSFAKIADFDRKVSRLYNLKHTYKQTLNDKKWQKLAQYNEREKRLKKTKKDKKRLKRLNKTKNDTKRTKNMFKI